jgi:hypothetical protein
MKLVCYASYRNGVAIHLIGHKRENVVKLRQCSSLSTTSYMTTYRKTNLSSVTSPRSKVENVI